MRLPRRVSVYSDSVKLLSKPRHIRFLATHANNKHFDAIVIGAGPGGLTCASNLLDQGLSNICMFDPAFNAGRINEKYREVPSNTKAGLFVQWATATDAFSDIIDSTSKRNSNNAFEKLKSFNPDKTCQLSDAVDVAKLLSDGLRHDSRVTSITSAVNKLVKQNDVWSVPEQSISADRVLFATGAHPRPNPISNRFPHLRSLDLDTTLAPTRLREQVPSGSTVAVIGASHSAILALKNLYDLGDVSIVNFYRSPLLYAIYKEGWILYDNTGLKGTAADWAKEVLDTEHLPARIRRINLKQDQRSEQQVYQDELKNCTHIVSAIGFDRNKVPTIVEADGTAEQILQPEFDPLTGKFYKDQQRSRSGSAEYLQGLYGAGIAFPERVTDPEGNVESAVGWFKFMKFVKRVVPQWIER